MKCIVYHAANLLLGGNIEESYLAKFQSYAIILSYMRKRRGALPECCVFVKHLESVLVSGLVSKTMEEGNSILVCFRPYHG